MFVLSDFIPRQEVLVVTDFIDNNANLSLV
jgi:hypothetical protein